MAFGLSSFLRSYDIELLVPIVHFHGKLMGSSCVTIAYKTAKLFMCFLPSSQHGCTIVLDVGLIIP